MFCIAAQLKTCKLWGSNRPPTQTWTAYAGFGVFGFWLRLWKKMKKRTVRTWPPTVSDAFDFLWVQTLETCKRVCTGYAIWYLVFFWTLHSGNVIANIVSMQQCRSFAYNRDSNHPNVAHLFQVTRMKVMLPWEPVSRCFPFFLQESLTSHLIGD